MKKFYAKKDGDFFIFEGEELNHFNVLRCCVGEEILCLGLDGNDYFCKVTEVSKKRAVAQMVTMQKNTKNPSVEITVFQGMVKGEKIDLIVQKLTELGISYLYTFESDYTIAKCNNNKIERLNRISQEACKQCGRSKPLIIDDGISFNDMINMLPQYDIVLFANEKNTNRELVNIAKDKKIALIIGSEGGFSDEEVNKLLSVGVKCFGLGNRILRAETACIAMASIVGHMVEV